MGTALQISLQEYLQTSYRPDREYVDGEVRERNVGKYEHARVQALLAAWFVSQEKQWGIKVVTEQRVQVNAGSCRIPDVAVITRGQHPEIIVDPPILVVEIQSPDDTYSETQRKTTDYTAMGIQNIWIVDPETQTGRMCRGNAWIEARILDAPGTLIQINLDELFAALLED